MHPRKARACDLAFYKPIQITIEGTLPEGGKDRASIQVASIVPFLIMKAQALNCRLKEKDAYDIHYCLPGFHIGKSVKLQNLDNSPTLCTKTGGLNQYYLNLQPK